MIQFAHPSSLWLLLLIIPIVLLYLLKQKRREVEVPSILLWKQAIEDLRAHTPFQRLKSNLLLLLQILAIVLLTAILSQPYLPQGTQKARKWILVLDTSAGMEATDERPDRFRVAQQRLLDLLNSLSPSNEVMLLSVSSRSSIIQSYTSNIDLVRRKLSRLKPEDVGSNWAELSLVLEPLIKERPRPKIFIASDFANFPNDFASQIAFEPMSVGKEAENIAITRAMLQGLPEAPGKQMFFYQLENFGTKRKDVDVEISADTNLIDAYRVTLDPSTPVDRTLEIEIRQPVMISLRLKSQDIFRLDDDFIALAQPAQKIRVRALLRDPFLLKALGVLPSIQLDGAGEIRIASTLDAQPGIYFLTAPATAPPAEVIQWDTSHPTLRFVDAGLWRFVHCSILEPPPDSTILIETSKGPVAYALDEGNNRKVVFGFGLADTNIPLLAGFPVLIQNALGWISEGRNPAVSQITGAAYKFEGPMGKNVHSPYLNFLDASESNVHPHSPAGGSGSEIGSLLRRQDVSIWFLILLVAVIIVEWWVFHQRIHVEA